MELERLEEFVVLASELNFGRAATRSYASRTAFSRHMNELEDYFGVQLVERSRPVRLTPAGEVLLHLLQTLSPRLEELKAAVRDAQR
jgi:LysR family transcriptional regulator, benzoate and cis,cis-muconate-responsive activator of ben and cat genes